MSAALRARVLVLLAGEERAYRELQNAVSKAQRPLLRHVLAGLQAEGVIESRTVYAYKRATKREAARRIPLGERWYLT